MTRSVLTNESNDIYLDANGNLAFSAGLPAVQQACMNVSRASLGEEIFATGNGIPFFQAVFVGVPNIQAFESSLRAALLSVPDVISVQSLTTTIQNNVLSYTAVIESTDGQTFTIAQELSA